MKIDKSAEQVLKLHKMPVEENLGPDGAERQAGEPGGPDEVRDEFDNSRSQKGGGETYEKIDEFANTPDPCGSSETYENTDGGYLL